MDKKIIVFDIDGTLSIVGDRVKYLNETPANWDAFYDACSEDKYNPPANEMLWLINLYPEIYDVYYVTGRRESVREKTLSWLFTQCSKRVQSEKLLMRPDGDYRHDTQVKPELVKDFIDKIFIVFEDRNSMVKKWRELGVTCFQVADGDF